MTVAAPSRKQPGSHAGTAGWLGVATGVLAWDLFAPETLTDAFGRARSTPEGRFITTAVWLLLTGHLFGILPSWADPFRLPGQNSQPSARASRQMRNRLNRCQRST
jgi:hypothetical protein